MSEMFHFRQLNCDASRAFSPFSVLESYHTVLKLPIYVQILFWHLGPGRSAKSRLSIEYRIIA